MSTPKRPCEHLSVQVPRELKQALRKQAKRAGVSLAEWVRTRLDLEGTDPDEMRAFLTELESVSQRLQRSNAKFDATIKRMDADEREMSARLAKAAREGRQIAEQLLKEGRAPLLLKSGTRDDRES